MSGEARRTLEILASAAAAACESEGKDTPLTFGKLLNVIDYSLTHRAVEAGDAE